MKKKLRLFMAFLVLQTGIFFGCAHTESPALVKEADDSGRDMRIPESAEKRKNTDTKKEKPGSRKVVQIQDVSFFRLSNREIKITWPDQSDPDVKRYLIKRRKVGETHWQTIDTQVSDGTSDRESYAFTDSLLSLEPQQYEYRIDVKLLDDEGCEGKEGESVLASNVLICLDPGHYEGQNVVETEGVRYAEGDFTLELAKEVKRILEESYGITVSMTRDSGTISIGGYINGDLDQGHISLRGEYAKGCNLFLSLHTNANQDGANGADTFFQPIEITKPIIIVNTIAKNSATALDVGNEVGTRLAEANAGIGIALPGKFQRVDSQDDLVSWSDAFNDGLDICGTICCRMGEEGDYYGVLKGAANVGVPGMIVEHGFHTVSRMRELAVQGELKNWWAEADADGIAEGFGMEKKMED